jgi:hypothetical protein
MSCRRVAIALGLRRTTVLVEEEDPLLGATVAVFETDREYLVVHLDLYEVDALARMLATVAAGGLRQACPWCDSLGLVDGDDGPEFCEHHLVDT